MLLPPASLSVPLPDLPSPFPRSWLLSLVDSGTVCREMVFAGVGRALASVLRLPPGQYTQPAQLHAVDTVARIAWRSQELQVALGGTGVLPEVLSLLASLVASGV